jgi:hypothetical protein
VIRARSQIYGYGGTYPGGTFEAVVNRPVHVTWRNSLPEKHILPTEPLEMEGSTSHTHTHTHTHTTTYMTHASAPQAHTISDDGVQRQCIWRTRPIRREWCICTAL